MQPRSIFRSAAIQPYTQRHELGILPRFIMPLAVRFLWILLALLVLGTVGVWSVPLPLYLRGTAMRFFILPHSDGSAAGLGVQPSHPGGSASARGTEARQDDLGAEAARLLGCSMQSREHSQGCVRHWA